MKKINLFVSVVVLISLFFISTSTGTYASNETNINKERILVKFKDDKKSDNLIYSINSKHEKSNIKIKKKYSQSNIELWELDSRKDADDIINELQSDPSVEFIQVDYKLGTYKNIESIPVTDPYFIYQWGLSNTGQLIGVNGVPGIDINAIKSWTITKGSQSTLVGVLDSGIDINHPEIKDNVFVNNRETPNNGIDDDGNGYIDDANGWDFLNNDSTVYDSYMQDIHGTHVAGIIAASNDEQGICGVAPNVKILPLKFMDSVEGGYTSDAIEAIEYAQTMGVTIINCSWSGTEMNPALKHVMKHSNILFVCSAGNSGVDLKDNPVYPACFNLDNILTVGAIDNQGNIASFSNYGKDVDVVAPGVNILSIIPENGYLFGGGTSAAAPHVTGIAALAQSISPNIRSSKLADIIRNNVIKDKDRYSNIKSKGRVDAFKVLVDLKKK